MSGLTLGSARKSKTTLTTLAGNGQLSERIFGHDVLVLWSMAV